MAGRVPALKPRDGFLHVVNDYRYFALAAASWRQFGPSGPKQKQDQANNLVPGIGVLFQDSLLAHARALIDFYAKDQPRPTDVVLADFDLSIKQARKDQVASYKESIEVHLLHITAWRDVAYRSAATTLPAGLLRQRLDWDRENPRLIDALMSALADVSEPPLTPWSQPFRLLHESATAVSSKPFALWPKELTEKADVSAYLSSQGL